MAINFKNPEELNQLQRAIRYNWELGADARQTRDKLIDIYRDKDDLPADLIEREDDTLVNLFQQFVTGLLLTTAYRTPRFSVKARTINGVGFDARIQAFLNRYVEILDFQRLIRQWGVDCAFGYAIAKVINGPAPKGIHSPVAPRVYRVNPNHVIMDMSASDPEEASFIANMYLMPLKEAQQEPSFNESIRTALQPWRETSGTNMLPHGIRDSAVFVEEQTRLIDVYFPTQGVVVTWPCPSDQFADISGYPLCTRQTPINPYVCLRLLTVPDDLEQIASLKSLRGLHFLANDMLQKAAAQCRASQRNPVSRVGNEQDVRGLFSAGDNEPVFLNEPQSLTLWQFPGADPAVLNMGNMALGLFSQFGGNLEVALGQSAGADTARQTQALIGQISARQSIDRGMFEGFLTTIAKRLASLAFIDETLELEATAQVPKTTLVYNIGWAPPNKLPRIGEISDYMFETVPFSSAFRSPQERLQQLQTASQSVLQWMTAKAQGLPINLEAVIKSFGESFDLLPELQEWWTGEDPTPMQKTMDTYQSLAGPAQGSEVNYNSNAQQEDAMLSGYTPPAGGLADELQ